MMEWTDLPDDYGKTPDGKYYEKKPIDFDLLFNSVARELARQADAASKELNDRCLENFAMHMQQAEGKLVKAKVEALLYDIMGPRSYCIPNPSERGG